MIMKRIKRSKDRVSHFLSCIKIREKAIDCIDHKTNACDGLQKILYAKIPSIHRNPFGLKPRPVHFHRKAERIYCVGEPGEEISRVLNRSFAIWHLSTLQPSHPTLFPRFSRKSCTLICIFANHLPISIRFSIVKLRSTASWTRKPSKDSILYQDELYGFSWLFMEWNQCFVADALRDNEESRNCTIMTNATIDGF